MKKEDLLKRDILGLIEKVMIIGSNDKNKKIVARIDSGATASSIDVKLAEELELKQIKKVKLVKSASGITKRHMVKTKVEIMGKIMIENFTLADRSRMTYSVLIGQDVLKEGNFLIDPNKKVMKR